MLIVNGQVTSLSDIDSKFGDLNFELSERKAKHRFNYLLDSKWNLGTDHLIKLKYLWGLTKSIASREATPEERRGMRPNHCGGKRLNHLGMPLNLDLLKKVL